MWAVMTRRQASRQAGPRRAREPRPVTPESLEAAAVFYLQRYAASTQRVRRVLRRRVDRAARLRPQDDVDPAAAAAWIEAILQRYQKAGLLDDDRYAEGRAATLFRRGDSQRAIAARLRADGLDDDRIKAALARAVADATPGGPNGADDEGDAAADVDLDPDLMAAAVLARRRRLGPYRPDAESRAAHRQRDLAALARKGFRADVARRIVDADSVDTLEADPQLPRPVS